VKNYRAAVKEEGHHIVWLHKIIPGGTDRSYGIQVARLAGLPEEVIDRARQVLAELEAAGARSAGLPAPGQPISEERRKVQLTLFEAEEHPVMQEIRTLDLSVTTPIEALTLLHRLQKQATS
jgi:DNA mismatch repair protein MutS